MDDYRKSEMSRERIILVIYGIYTWVMVGVVYRFHWNQWIVPFIIAGLAVSVVMYFSEYRTYEFRVLFTSLMMWFNISVYLLNIDDFTGAFSTMSAMIVLLSIYCIPKLTYVGTVVYTLHLLYHFLFLRDIAVGLGQEGLRNILRIASVYVVQFVTYSMMKTQADSNAVMLENINAVRSAEQSKDDFMANMSHEIRTPINTVCGISEMVLREDLSEEARAGVYDIQTAGRQLLSLVSDILDFTELSSGKMEIVPDTYNITSTINDILNMAVAKASGKNIELLVDCDAGIPRGLVGDEQKIRRAIMNVLDNAIKFTEEGGVRLTISFRRESYGGNLLVTVQDTGIGIKEEMLETLFTSFSQIDTKRNRRVSGMGLGMSIAKVIANRMGGFVTVKSTYGKGTEVRMVFPQEVNQAAPVASLDKPRESRVLLYLNVDKYQNSFVRDGYIECTQRMVEQLGVSYRRVASLTELRRRMGHEEFTHLFVGWAEYCEDREYFERLSEKMRVVLVLDRDHKQSIEGSHLLCVYKPFYVMTIASVLNGRYDALHVGRNVGSNIRLVAPEAEVLVVDDNLMNLKVVEGLLRPYKVRVFVAESGQEALDKMEANRFDIIFMDHMMPEMDGIETFHRIRQKPGSYYQNVPVVALTANAIGGAREMFLQEGFADYVSKPIEVSALERVLHKFIPAGKQIREYRESLAEKADGGLSDGGAGDTTQEENGAVSGGMPADGGAPITLEGIDTKLGISYCGGRIEDYLDVIRTYHKIGAGKAEEIRRSYQAGDWKNYTTLVHAVKSTSLGIGAAGLSGMAKELEAAGKAEDADYINAHTQEMLDEYERVLGVIGASRAVFPEDEGEPGAAMAVAAEDLQEIAAEEVREHFARIEEEMESFDVESIQACMGELYQYRYQGEPLQDMLSPVNDMLNDFDVMGAQEAFEKIRDALR